jgi:cytidine deaminase
MEEEDKALIEIARDLISKRFREDHHHIAAALRTTSGKVFTGVHVEAYIGRITVCGEAVAIGAAATGGDTQIDTIVAVNELGAIVSPCGMCRELISDYSNKAKVIIDREGQLIKVDISELLPDKYSREENSNAVASESSNPINA